MSWYFYHPCQNGHVWTWTSSTTNISWPDYDLPCQCGMVLWRDRERANHDNPLLDIPKQVTDITQEPPVT